MDYLPDASKETVTTSPARSKPHNLKIKKCRVRNALIKWKTGAS